MTNSYLDAPPRMLPPEDGLPCVRCTHRGGAHCAVCKVCHATQRCSCKKWIEPLTQDVGP